MSHPDIHVIQLTGRTCPGRNCAAASDAMAIAAATAGTVRLSADRVRTESKISCTPGVHTRSGGLPIYAVVAVALLHRVVVEYGNPPKPWPSTELEKRLRAGWGAIVLGDYEAAPVPATTTFDGDHSAWVHGLQTVDGKLSTHWHDPLRGLPRWVPLAAVVRYWRDTADGGHVAGYAGFVKLPPAADMPAHGQGWVDLHAGDTFYRARGTWNHDYPVKLGAARKLEVGGPRWVGAEHTAILADGRKINVRRISSIKGDEWITAWVPSPTSRHLTPV